MSDNPIHREGPWYLKRDHKGPATCLFSPRRSQRRFWTLRIYHPDFGNDSDTHVVDTMFGPEAEAMELVCVCKPNGRPLGILADPKGNFLDVRPEDMPMTSIQTIVAPRDFFQGWGAAHQDATILSNYRRFRHRCIQLGCPLDSVLPLDMMG